MLRYIPEKKREKMHVGDRSAGDEKKRGKMHVGDRWLRSL
jgi:hypothetical protein